MNRTIKEATVQPFHDQTTQELNEHLQAFLLAYNHANQLKTLHSFTPHEFVCAQWILLANWFWGKKSYFRKHFNCFFR